MTTPAATLEAAARHLQSGDHGRAEAVNNRGSALQRRASGAQTLKFHAVVMQYTGDITDRGE